MISPKEFKTRCAERRRAEMEAIEKEFDDHLIHGERLVILSRAYDGSLIDDVIKTYVGWRVTKVSHGTYQFDFA